MNMDVLSRVFNIFQRVGGMEQIGQFMTIVYGIVCVFGILNCLLGYRILRFWMMIFGFLIGAGAGFGVTYLSGVEDKMVIAGAMAGLGIVLAIVSFLVYRAGIFVLGFGIGISLSIYLVHPTSSFSFFLCILVGVGLGILAMRYAKGVIIIGTSILGGVLAGVSIAKIGGLEQFPYGVGMAVGIALLGMLIQFAINKDHYDDDDEEDEEDDEPEEEMRRFGKKKKFAQDRENVSEYNGANRRRNSSDRYSDARNDTGEIKGNRSRSRNGDSDRRNSSGNRSESRRNGRNTGSSDRNSSSDNRRRTSAAGSSGRSRNGRNSPSEGSRRSQSRSGSENSYSQNRRNTSSAGRSYYDDGDDYDASRERFDPDYRETPDTYEDFEKSQQRKRQLDIENMADFEDDEFEQLRNHEDSKNNRDLLRNLEPDDYDEWEDN
ncbi:DUF4203 domain-containing protein [Blautia schinkii]|uniref:TMEM198/TM7SF3 family protein n=1 Tax=Blautia schinkii TaxID=180164 RepID=UPI00156E6657|nr:DUF4203 domain-containing protein [Blautia schinkii]NSG81147.1 DUF4203 domain-containing protein [Blautia schinkii]